MSESWEQDDSQVEPNPEHQLNEDQVYPEDHRQYSKHATVERTSVHVMNGLIEATAIFLVAFSPIAFGATERWSKLVVVTAACSMCALWCFRAILKRKLAFAKGPLNLLVAAFILLACIQLVPLPGFLASRLSPATVQAETGSLPLAAESALAGPWSAAQRPTQGASARSISVNPAAGRSSLYLIVSYAIAFLVILNTFRRRSQISRLLGAVIGIGFTVAILGILGHVAPNGKLLWFRDPPGGAIPFGPFVNRNHFAGYLVMVMPIALGMLTGIRNRDKRTLLGFAAAVMAGAVLLSASRGGVISLAAGAAAFGLMLISTRAAKKNLFPLVLVGCIALIGAASIGIGPLLARSTDLATGDLASEFRWPVWKDTARMIADFPVLGVGMGCFRYIFPAYKTLPVQLLFTHTENEYLQLLAEMGIVGFSIGAIFIVLILKTSFRGLKGKRSTYSRGMIIGLTAAVIGMLVHSLVDFNLHVPSNGMLFAMILGILVVLSSMHISGIRRISSAAWLKIPSPRLLKGETVVATGMAGSFCMSLAAMCLLAFCVASTAGSFIAERELDSIERQALRFVKGEGDFDVADGIHTVRAALAKERENGEWHFKAGLFYQTLGQMTIRNTPDDPTGSYAGYLYKLAINEFSQASKFDPFNCRYRAAKGIAYSELGEYEKADAAFRKAVKINPTHAWVHREYGRALWSHDRKTAQAAFRRAFDLDPRQTRTTLTALAQQTDDLDELRKCISDNSEAVLEFAMFLANNSLTNEAEEVLVSLVPKVGSDKSNQDLAARVFFKLGQLRQNSGNEQEAMACLLKAVALQPNSQVYYEELGYTCLRQKRYEEARKFLEQRLRMAPAENGRVFLALAEVYENVGPSGTANKYYRRALDALPESWNVSRGQALRGLQRTQEQ